MYQRNKKINLCSAPTHYNLIFICFIPLLFMLKTLRLLYKLGPSLPKLCSLLIYRFLNRELFNMQQQVRIVWIQGQPETSGNMSGPSDKLNISLRKIGFFFPLVGLLKGLVICEEQLKLLEISRIFLSLPMLRGRM